MHSRKLLALIFSLLAIAPALAGYMTLLGAGVGSIQPVVSWVSTTDLTFPSSSLTFSRTSLATMFDSTGKLTYAPNNLLLQSNNFTTWTKSNITVATGVADPTGGTNASTLTATAANGFIYSSGITIGSNVGINAIWMRRRTGSGAIRLYGFNNVTQVVTSQVSSSWALVYTAPVAGNGIGFSFQIDMVASGDQIDVYAGSAAIVTYETTPRTADQVITTASAYYGPRIDYDPNTLAVKGLLIEESRTWVALWNRDFTNAAWVKTNVTAAKDQTGIDGVSNSASSLVASASNGTVLQAITLASSQRATSAYVKRLVGSGAVSMTTDGGTTWTDITSQLGVGSYARAVIPAQTVTNPSVGFKFAASGDSIAVDYFGNENGAFQTSPLYVTSASVTRAADVVQFTGAALAALQGSAGSFIYEGFGYNTSPVVFAGSGGSQYVLYSGGSNLLQTYNGTIVLAAGSGTIPAAAAWRGATGWSSGSRSIVLSGGTVASDANTHGTFTNVYLGSNQSSYWINSWIKSFATYNQRLPDATLQARSVVGASYAANDNANPFAPQFAANDNLPVHWRIAL